MDNKELGRIKAAITTAENEDRVTMGIHVSQARELVEMYGEAAEIAKENDSLKEQLANAEEMRQNLEAELQEFKANAIE